MTIANMTMTPNKSPEPTRVIAVSGFASVAWSSRVIGRGWLSFFR